MSSTDARTALQLRSLVKPSGELEVSLAEVPIPEPGPGEVLVRLEAAPINPSDLGLLFGGRRHDAARRPRARASGRSSPRRSREAAMKAMAGRGSAPRCRSATKAPAWSSPPAVRPRRRRCSARPSRCSAARCTRSTAPAGRAVPAAAGGRDAGRRRLVLRQPADRARHGRDDAARGPQRAGAHRGRVEPRPDAQPDLHRRRRRSWSTSCASPSRRRCCGRSAPPTSATRARRASWSDLTEALAATGATLAFDAIGGGKLGGPDPDVHGSGDQPQRQGIQPLRLDHAQAGLSLRRPRHAARPSSRATSA